MKFKDPLFIFLLVPATLCFFFYLLGWIGKEATLRFSSLKLVKDSGGRKSSLRRLVPAVLRLAALFFLTLAVMRPQTGTGEEKSTQHVIAQG